MNDNRELDRLDNVALAEGAHSTWEQGACLMEAVAYVAGEPHSDRPQCASPILGAFGRNLNDSLPDDLRQRLKPLVPLLIGTAGDGRDEAREYLALDWVIRTSLPTWLRLSGLDDHAAALQKLAPIVDLDTIAAARPVMRAAKVAAMAVTDAAALTTPARLGRKFTLAARITALIPTRVTDAAVREAMKSAATVALGRVGPRGADGALAPTVRELQLSAIELFGRAITAGARAQEPAPTPARASSRG